MNGTIRQLFTEEFEFDLDKMEINKFYDVSEFNIGVKSYNEETGKDVFSLVTNIVKKDKQQYYKIKLEDREFFEEPVSGRHLYAVTKSYNSNGMDYSFVENLVEGASIYTSSGFSKIEKIEKLHKDYVYDIQTEANNYYTNGILSHNSTYSHLPSVTGGYAIKFSATTRNRVTKLENITIGGEIVGIKMRVRNYKNKAGIPYRDAEMNLYFDGGFKSDDEYVDFIIRFEIFKQGGAWFTCERWGEPIKLNGKAKVLEWLKSNPEKYEELKQEVTNRLLGFSKELDSNNIDPVTTEDGKMQEDSDEEKSYVESLASQALDLDLTEDPPVLDI